MKHLVRSIALILFISLCILLSSGTAYAGEPGEEDIAAGTVSEEISEDVEDPEEPEVPEESEAPEESDDPEPEDDGSSIEITKKNEDPEISPEGTVFTVYSDPECTQEAASYTADSHGQCTISADDENLTPYLPETDASSSLYLKETQAPAGCSINSEVHTITITAVQDEGSDNPVSSYLMSTDNKNNLTVRNRSLSVKVDKTDAETGQSLANASVQVADSDKGEEVASWITDGCGPKDIGRLLRAGHMYTMRELEAPKGYALSEDIHFSVGNDGTVTVGGIPVKTVVMKNHKIPEEEEPETPKEPEKPQEPTVPEAPGKPNIPETPESQNVPETPVITQTVHVPEISDASPDDEGEMKMQEMPQPAETVQVQITRTVAEVRTNPSDSSVQTAARSPRTGDSTPLHVWTITFALFAAATAVIVILRAGQK